MSEGAICNCPRAEHEGQRPERAGCPMYAENGKGGMCRSCNYGFHRACHEAVLPSAVTVGVCLRCSWHSTYHALLATGSETTPEDR